VRSWRLNLDSTANRQPTINITGERVMLGPLRRDLTPLYERWINDLQTMRTYDMLRPLTTEQVEQWYERESRNLETIRFTIYERASSTPIGKMALYDINHHQQRATFSILIGAEAGRGKGYGTEATRLMLDYAFTILGVHNVFLEAVEFNVAGIRAYENAGFKECGRRREAFLLFGRRWDKVFMDCLATEFKGSVLAPQLAAGVIPVTETQG
jgi:RimJ/RimL family protein N-acetyltransferase